MKKIKHAAPIQFRSNDGRRIPYTSPISIYSQWMIWELQRHDSKFKKLWRNKEYTNLDNQFGTSIVDIKAYFNISSVNLSEDYSTLVSIFGRRSELFIPSIKFIITKKAKPKFRTLIKKDKPAIIPQYKISLKSKNQYTDAQIRYALAEFITQLPVASGKIVLDTKHVAAARNDKLEIRHLELMSQEQCSIVYDNFADQLGLSDKIDSENHLFQMMATPNTFAFHKVVKYNEDNSIRFLPLRKPRGYIITILKDSVKEHSYKILLPSTTQIKYKDIRAELFNSELSSYYKGFIAEHTTPDTIFSKSITITKPSNLNKASVKKVFNNFWKDTIDDIVKKAKEKATKKDTYDIARHLSKKINSELDSTDYQASIDNTTNRIQILIDDVEVYLIDLA